MLIRAAFLRYARYSARSILRRRHTAYRRHSVQACVAGRVAPRKEGKTQAVAGTNQGVRIQKKENQEVRTVAGRKAGAGSAKLWSQEGAAGSRCVQAGEAVCGAQLSQWCRQCSSNRWQSQKEEAEKARSYVKAVQG